ncbi:DUF1659 domain-containing protein [Limosilactobacillus difficilis]|uniref:DUF1659 domain-containing protein n=1 Tax=Limosilactobacillus difficilis TaxID=2991838 RepID=UPI0024BA9880|nr:hypothetical protein [Limosilactobacillus difficilis]
MKKTFQNAKLQLKMKGIDHPNGVYRTLNNVVEEPTDEQIAIIKTFMHTISDDQLDGIKLTIADALTD